MSKEVELENYLIISPKKFAIYLFDKKNLKNSYKEEFSSEENFDFKNLNILKKFLDQNIYKIEKSSGKFVENISIVLENEQILDLHMGIKKKNYNNFVTQENLINSLQEAKDLFKENYQNEKIIHMLVNKYFINKKKYNSFKNNLESDDLGLEIQFKFISNFIINDLNSMLENYQIKVSKYIDASYVKTFFDNNLEVSEMAHKIVHGYNENEVSLIQKNQKKLAFFEKFFQLFS